MACRKVVDKRELIRLICTPEGNVEIDSSGKKTGRGAYLCRTWECWEAGLKGNRLERALRNSVTESNCEQLLKQAKELLKELISDEGK